MDAGDLRAEDLLGAVPDALWGLDGEGRTTYANARLAGLLGLAVDELLGRSAYDLVDASDAHRLRGHLAGGSSSANSLALRLRRPDGTTTPAVLTGAPVVVDGEPRGHLFRVEDDDERHALLEALQRRDAQFADLQSLARIGSWERDLRTGEGSWSDETFRLCRVDPDRIDPTATTFFSLLHPDDRGALVAQYDAMLAGGPPMDADARLADATELTWLRVRGVVTRDEDGTPLRVGGTVQDVTEAKRHTEGLEFLAELSGAANRVQSLTELFFSVDRDIRLHSGWRALMAAGPHYKDPSRPFFAPMQDGMSEELTRTAEELARTVFTTHRHATAPGPHGTVLLAGPAMLGDALATIIVSDTGSAVPPSRADLALYEQMLHHLAQVEERARAAADLAAARDEALRASTAKSEFLATMSHEIRTPLNGVIGLSELLRHTELSAEQARLAAGIDQAGRSLLALVNDILDLSKIEAGRLDLEEVDFELRAVLGQSVGLVLDQARAKGLIVDVDVSPGVPEVLRGDPVRLGQVVVNLASNAVKFTAVGRVAVRATWADDVLRVEVEDSGIGIAPEAREKLFAPFSQADSSTTRTHGGTGLGLAISSRIVAATGGEIGVRPAEGAGSLFWFTMRLPASERAEAVTPAADSPRTADADAPLRGRVLVVEDNAINQLVAEGMLRRLGYDVAMAEHGSAALSLLAEEPGAFDAILMDCQMPVMDGFDATRAVRALEGEARRTPVIAMTAAALTAERERCFEAGMDDFLTKPVDASVLAAVLDRWVPRVAAATPRDDRQQVSGRLGEFLDTYGVDPDVVARMVELFDELAATSLAGLRQGAASGSVVDVARHAHSLRGGATNLGLGSVADLCAEVEEDALAGQVPAPAVLDRLASAAEQGGAVLAGYLRSRALV